MLSREKTIDSINDIKEYFEIKFQELPYVNKINLRIDPINKSYMSSCGNILGAMLPKKPNTYSKNENVKVIWLGPNEWLIVNSDLFLKLQNETGDLEASVTDVSENRTIIRISGRKIIVLLSKFFFQLKEGEQV